MYSLQSTLRHTDVLNFGLVARRTAAVWQRPVIAVNTVSRSQFPHSGRRGSKFYSTSIYASTEASRFFAPLPYQCEALCGSGCFSSSKNFHIKNLAVRKLGSLVAKNNSTQIYHLANTLNTSFHFLPKKNKVSFSIVQIDQQRELSSIAKMSATKKADDSGRQVLPKNVKPIEYTLKLEPNFETFKFDGDELLELEVVEDSDFISLNTLEIDIKETILLTASGKEIKPESVKEDKEEQYTTFKFSPASSLKKGDHVKLSIKFVGELNDKMAGFYRSTYEEDGKTKYLATTQMEATDCRRAFPCIDEPNQKAKFSITLVGDKNLTYLSNMDIKEEHSVSETKKEVVFNTTPKMSTYLVAFIVGDLRSVESEYKFRDVPVKVYTTPGYETKGQYAAELAAHALEYYEQCFGIKYPLPKMDMVGIHDFTAGAMENWGLVTYRMVDLLYEKGKSTTDIKFRVAEVVDHELAHQWFGNYCTLDFWDSLWLNESFATYMSWKCCDHFHPEWNVWDNFVGESLQYALGMDSLKSSHPIEVPVKRADEINQIFDAISYEKGSAVLRMLANWLGEDTFIKGVSLYLTRHAWSNAKTSALWAALSEVSGKDVEGTMKIWTESVGYPLVTVKEADGKVSVEQHRFLRTGDVKPEDDKTLFPIFVGLKTENGLDESIILNQRSEKLQVDAGSFFKINGNSNGVYRVNYEPERWAKLGDSASKLSVEDRIGLVADAGALSTPGYSKTSNLLSLVSGWKSEPSYFVWSEMLSRLAGIRSTWKFEDQKTFDALKAVTRSLVADKCHKLGWEFSSSESFLEQRLKSLLFGSAASSDDETVVSAAKKMFADYVAGDKSAIYPDLRSSVFHCVASHGGETEFNQLFDIYKNPQSVDEKIVALRNMGAFRDAEILKKVLGLLMDGTVRTQDIYLPLIGMSRSKVGIETAFDWMTGNWDALCKMLPPGLSMLKSVVQICTAGFTKKEQYDKVKAFFDGKDTKGYDQGLAQALESIKSNAAWVKRDNADVEAWLKENKFLL